MNTLANRGMHQPASIIAPSVADAAALVGRILLAVLFLKSGWGKIGGFDQTAAMMASKAGTRPSWSTRSPSRNRRPVSTGS